MNNAMLDILINITKNKCKYKTSETTPIYLTNDLLVFADASDCNCTWTYFSYWYWVDPKNLLPWKQYRPLYQRNVMTVDLSIYCPSCVYRYVSRGCFLSGRSRSSSPSSLSRSYATTTTGTLSWLDWGEYTPLFAGNIAFRGTPWFYTGLSCDTCAMNVANHISMNHICLFASYILTFSLYLQITYTLPLTMFKQPFVQ